MRYYLLLVFFVCKSLFLQAQDSTQIIFKPDVQELLNAKVEVNQEQTISTGSFKTTALREAAGIVSVITADMIKNSGARDIVELLRFAPGIDFGMDPDGTTSVTVRGNYAMEGKLLVLVDGVQMNEVAYGGFFFYPRVPLENIDRIEIIRGPGSAIYGGFAALAVINIISKNYLQGIGNTASLQAGISQNGFSRGNIQFTTAQKYANETEVYFSGYVGETNRNNTIFTHPNEMTISYKDSSWVRPVNMNIGIKHKRFNMRVIYDQVRAKTIHNLGEHVNNGLYTTLSYNFQINKQLTLTPRFQSKRQTPWDFQDGSIYYQDLTNMRIIRTSFDAVLLYQPSDKLSWATGVEYFIDDANYARKTTTFYNGKNALSFSNIGAFTEFVFSSKYGNIVAGARFDKYGISRPAFVPRIAYTKAFENFHVKYLYSYAFKNPTLMNISVSGGQIFPEYVRSSELEIGYHWRNKFFLNANIFHIKIFEFISYEYEPISQVDIYTNAGTTGSNGAEVELRYVHKKGYFNINFSSYVPEYVSNSPLNFASLQITKITNENQVQKLIVEGQERVFAGLAPQRLTAQVHQRLSKKIGVNLTAQWFSQKYAYLANADYSEREVITYPSTAILNLNLTFDDVFTKGLDLSAGIFNLLNERQFLTVYQRLGSMPFLEQGRELVVKVKYRL
ncbi:Outer membrane receptor for ferrienterochelin and colicins [Thermoflexibacter ruber]|uniref:Outer membrane receptor for ferrienterochelin and colicins n=1 Tax=Thermoflexibacter ruber TaxID=1003 RepID=A0A1I2GIZ5_9BACT|nr:Outer membrane receptor for ferrienterochelin and colicins [Thermoflexibacter ruber]